MSSMETDYRLIQARQIDIVKTAQDLGAAGLRRNGSEWTGPCPACGGEDRFNISVSKRMFLCRQCGAKGDIVALVRWRLDCDFGAALEWLCGPKEALTPETRARHENERAAAEEAERRREEAQDKMRRKAIAAAREIWLQGDPPEDTPVRAYLTRRGLSQVRLPKLPVSLRYHPALPYMVAGQGQGSTEIHRGPAMLAAVQGPDDRFSAVHRTWLDLDQPKGKARIVHEGQVQEAKKVWGSKKGGAIRLSTPIGADTLVMAEGIETTLSAMICEAIPGAAYWAGVDLGNMAGRRASGPRLKFAGIPDMGDDRAFVPPAWVRRLIYVMDGDSDPRFTEASVLAGLRRAKVLRPGLSAQLVRAPQGFDLNDLLLLQSSGEA